MENTEAESINCDELIMQQQRKIEKEISDNIPLISSLQPVAGLDSEYADDAVYVSKVKNLAAKYSSMRKTRPDGNCFFRAFAYAYLEYLISNKEDYEKFKEIAFKSKEKLIQQGYSQFTLEDFHDTFMEVVNRVGEVAEDKTSTTAGIDTPTSKPNNNDLKERLHKLLNEQGYSDYVVVYLRLITSGQLQDGADFYQNFIDGNCTIAEFCHQEVEPMYKESDHIHIIALCAALNAGVRVEYMDRADGDHVKAHDFPDGVDPKVFLLYRPGHYDILYPN